MKCMFVDDDTNLLSALKRQLETQFNIETCSSPERALGLITNDPEFNVVVTDYKMPVLNGVEFLRTIHDKAPTVLGIMLTGAGDVQMASEAINEANVFRFLTKPCSAVQLTKAISEAFARVQQLKTEHDLLEGTLAGCVKILTDILAVVDPVGFEQGRSIRAEARDIAIRMNEPKVWEVELAAMLLDLGTLVLPTPLIIKLRSSQQLTEHESKLWSRVPEVGAKFVSRVPRLEGVAELIKHSRTPIRLDKTNPVPLGASLLSVLKDVQRLTEKGMTKHEALRALELMRDRYDPTIIKVVGQYYNDTNPLPVAPNFAPIELKDLKVGQTVAQDIHTKDGVLLVKTGTVLDEMLIERVCNYHSFVGLADPIMIQLPHF